MDSTVEHAYRLCEAGKWNEALVQFETLASRNVGALEKAGFLIDQATCHSELGDFEKARALVAEAKVLTTGDLEAWAQVDFFAATLLLMEERREEGLEAISRLLRDYSDWFGTMEGRELYRDVQLQRAFSLMHVPRYQEARPALEEVIGFPLEDDNKVLVRCHLGRCYCEPGEYSLAKEQFSEANRLSVPEDWESIFHYYFGYSLYSLKEYRAAKREFLLCLQSGSEIPPSLKYDMLGAVSEKLGKRREMRLFEEMARSARKSEQD